MDPNREEKAREANGLVGMKFEQYCVPLNRTCGALFSGLLEILRPGNNSLSDISFS